MKSLEGQRVAILIQRTSRSLIIEEFRGSAGSDFDTAHEREEFRGSAGSDFDTAHQQELDYQRV